MLPDVTGLHQVSQTLSSDGKNWATVFAWDVSPDADGYAVDIDGAQVATIAASAAPSATITLPVAAMGQHSIGVAPTVEATPFTDLSFTVPPLVPTGLTGTPASATRVNLVCNPSAGATEYGWYRNGALLASTPTPSYSDGSVAPATAYEYQVDAAIGTVASALSAQVPVTTPAQVQVPPAPTGLTASVAGTPTAPTVVLDWNAVATPNVTYDIYRDGVLIASGVT